MRWFKPRPRLHIRTLSGHVFTVTNSPSKDLEGIMAEMVSAMAAPEAITCFVGQAGAAWIRASQIEAIWIAERYPD